MIRPALVSAGLGLFTLAGCPRGQPARPPWPAPPPVASAPSPPPEPAAAPAPSASAAPSPAPAESASPSEPPIEPLPEKTVVLHIGDSMAGALGIELNRQLEERGIKGVLRYKTASFIPNWAWGDELGLYLAQYRPDLVLISLGTNELEILEPERRAPTVRKLVGRLGEVPCVWLLPPLAAGQKSGLVDVIRQSASPCASVDNQEVFPGMPRVGDKIHPTMAARKEWARRVIDWLAAHRRPRAGRPWAMATGPNSMR
jgi:hypothetical protein